MAYTANSFHAVDTQGFIIGPDGSSITLQSGVADDFTLDLPVLTTDDTLVAANTTATLTNKILTADTNDIAANRLRIGTDTLPISGTPTAGQILKVDEAGTGLAFAQDSGIAGATSSTGDITTTNAGPTKTIETFDFSGVATNSTYYITSNIVARQTPTNNVAAITMRAAFSVAVDAATVSVSQIGATDSTIAFKTSSSLNVATNIDTTSVQIQVTQGLITESVVWHSSTVTVSVSVPV